MIFVKRDANEGNRGHAGDNPTDPTDILLEVAPKIAIEIAHRHQKAAPNHAAQKRVGEEFFEIHFHDAGRRESRPAEPGRGFHREDRLAPVPFEILLHLFHQILRDAQIAPEAVHETHAPLVAGAIKQHVPDHVAQDRKQKDYRPRESTQGRQHRGNDRRHRSFDDHERQHREVAIVPQKFKNVLSGLFHIHIL